MMKLYLVDGTYELFRAHFGAPARDAPDGRPIGAAAGLIQSLLMLLREEEPDFIACAFDHVVESFRNDLFAGYKTSAGVPEDLFAQFGLAERAARALGIEVWPMVEFEADDAIASAVARWKDDARVEKIVVCSVDKDLMNLVEGSRVAVWDRRRKLTYTESEVAERFGVQPSSIPDYLALVGDSADGITRDSAMGREGDGGGSVGVRTDGGHTGFLRGLDDSREGRRDAGAEPGGQARGRRAVQEADHAADGRADFGVAGRPSVGGRSPGREYLDLCEELGLGRLSDLPHRWL